MRYLKFLILSFFLATHTVHALSFGTPSPDPKDKKIAPEKIVPQVVFIHLNSATVEDFAKLKGVGKTKAQAIVDHREQFGNFKKVEDLLKVKGIGPAVLRDNKEILKL